MFLYPFINKQQKEMHKKKNTDKIKFVFAFIIAKKENNKKKANRI
jgi:hypothetical protein